MNDEQWRDIPGYPYYQASNCGRLRTLDKLVNCSRGKRTIKGKVLRPMDAVREGFDSSAISRCCKGTYGSHKGHTWRFYNGAEKGVVWTEPEAQERAA